MNSRVAKNVYKDRCSLQRDVLEGRQGCSSCMTLYSIWFKVALKILSYLSQKNF